MKLSEKTNYPKFYSKTSWGMKEMHDMIDNSIITNRNAFVTDHGISLKKPASARLVALRHRILQYGDSSEYDHLETYKTTDGDYIILSSVYGTMSENRRKRLQCEGWNQIYRMYDIGAETFMLKLTPIQLIEKLNYFK